MDAVRTAVSGWKRDTMLFLFVGDENKIKIVPSFDPVKRAPVCWRGGQSSNCDVFILVYCEPVMLEHRVTWERGREETLELL